MPHLDLPARNRTVHAFGALLALVLGLGASAAAQTEPSRVTFLSGDGKTKLVGYVFAPVGPAGARRPAVVLMHGRAGAYSSQAHGHFSAATLSKRHQFWGRTLARAGFIALLVDGFGPRGYPGGFPRFSYHRRPPELSEVDIRPLDAYGALTYLRSRPDVAPDRIALLGWSNGGSATLASLDAETLRRVGIALEHGFRAGVAFYPGCGLKDRFAARYSPYAPIRVYMGTADEEVSPKRCVALVNKGREQRGDIQIKLYDGATHSFDDPGRKRQSNASNAAVRRDAVARTLDYLRQQLGAPSRM